MDLPRCSALTIDGYGPHSLSTANRRRASL